MRRKPFKAWLLWDANGIYREYLHAARADAEAEQRDMPYRDAKWRISRVVVRFVASRKVGD